MSVAASQSILAEFTTHAAGGANVNADSTPTAILRLNGAANAATVVIALLAGKTGEYTAAFTVPSGVSIADRIQLVVSATIGGVAVVVVAWEDVVDATVSSRAAATAIPAGFSAIGGTSWSGIDSVGHDYEVGGGLIVATNNDKTGYSLTVTPPTAATIAAAILTVPANKIVTDASGFVTFNNTISNVTLGGTQATTIADLHTMTVNSGLGNAAFSAAALALSPTGGGSNGTIQVSITEARAQ